MLTISQPTLTDADLLALFRPGELAAALDGYRLAVYLQLRVRVRTHFRLSAGVLDAKIEECVDRTLARTLLEFASAARSTRILAWVFEIASQEIPTPLPVTDEQLVTDAMRARLGEVAAALREPESAGVSAQAADDDALYRCLQQKITAYLSGGRARLRSENFAMFIRFTFAGFRAKHLAQLYGRTPHAVNQRLSQTRIEMRAHVAECFEQEGGPE